MPVAGIETLAHDWLDGVISEPRGGLAGFLREWAERNRGTQTLSAGLN